MYDLVDCIGLSVYDMLLCSAKHAPSRNQSRRPIGYPGLEPGSASAATIHPSGFETRPRDREERGSRSRPSALQYCEEILSRVHFR